MLTEEDVSMIQYFHFEKDIESWGGWHNPETWARIKDSCPELLFAMENCRMHNKILDTIVEGLDYENIN